jgi:dTDP-D-glucose 4,6-dehydratase
MKYNFGTATEINNDEVVKEIIQKMQNEKLPQIQSAMN